MKKFLVLLATLLIANGVFAEKKSGAMELGLNGAYKIVSTNSKFYAFTGTDKGENDGGNGISFGVNFNYFLFQNNALVFGIGYETSNAKTKVTDAGLSATLEYQYAFINFQLGYRSYFSGFFGGLGFDYGLTTKAKIKQGGDFFNTTYEVGDATYDTKGKKASNFDLYLELGYNYEITQAISIDLLAKYRMGLSKIYSNSDAKNNGGFDEIKLRSIVFQLGFNYAF